VSVSPRRTPRSRSARTARRTPRGHAPPGPGGRAARSRSRNDPVTGPTGRSVTPLGPRGLAATRSPHVSGCHDERLACVGEDSPAPRNLTPMSWAPVIPSCQEVRRSVAPRTSTGAGCPTGADRCDRERGDDECGGGDATDDRRTSAPADRRRRRTRCGDVGHRHDGRPVPVRGGCGRR
jgi:hypothetical protein